MVDRTIDINHMPVGYSPNDFFYEAVDSQMTTDKCTAIDETQLYNNGGNGNIDDLWKNKCADILINPKSVDANTLSDCYQHELCRNKNYTNVMKKVNTNHSGADGRFQDSKTMYNMEYLTLGNLAFGVIKLSVVIGLIYYNK
jgi:hypothetical protein